MVTLGLAVGVVLVVVLVGTAVRQLTFDRYEDFAKWLRDVD